jgi:hypothetical protein
VFKFVLSKLVLNLMTMETPKREIKVRQVYTKEFCSLKTMFLYKEQMEREKKFVSYLYGTTLLLEK